ncbi:hypothetical protein OROHE_003875 [Orobanche hederae]
MAGMILTEMDGQDLNGTYNIVEFWHQRSHDLSCNTTFFHNFAKAGLFNPTNLSKDEQCLLCRSLVDAHRLRALCTQEETSGLKILPNNLCKILVDVKDAVKKWAELVNTHEMSPNCLTLLYHVLDLLSLKMNKIPVEKCLKLLWNSRSLGHALCVSPVIVIGEYTKNTEKLKKQGHSTNRSGITRESLNHVKPYLLVHPNWRHKKSRFRSH